MRATTLAQKEGMSLVARCGSLGGTQPARKGSFPDAPRSGSPENSARTAAFTGSLRPHTAFMALPH